MEPNTYRLVFSIMRPAPEDHPIPFPGGSVQEAAKSFHVKAESRDDAQAYAESIADQHLVARPERGEWREVEAFPLDPELSEDGIVIEAHVPPAGQRYLH